MQLGAQEAERGGAGDLLVYSIGETCYLWAQWLR